MTMPPLLDLATHALFLDIDGTLLDIAPTPQAVVMPPTLISDIATLRDRCSGALAVVSGRTLEDIDRLFAPLKLAAAGAHGALVRSDPAAPISHIQRPIPAALRAQFCALADQPGMFIEDKEVTLALHYRLVEDAHLPLARIADVETAARDAGFALLRGKKVLELKPAGTDKGTAIKNFVRHPPFAGRTPVFAGDDVTDSYGFGVLANLGGIGISVGKSFPGAQYCFDAPSDLRTWLHALASAPL
ncbi:MAG: trehalose-phosphatase [Alphaproteobacteria bacterium]|nr:trehalose-phosphatase [Alphaproteobacteria bacterium]MBV9539966.1 trehalose-phosphatase [Alphaproteobacteria bacterium]MBV9903081.1 trehalose-phosphatase [Alphaproteobacteria bacterium]